MGVAGLRQWGVLSHPQAHWGAGRGGNRGEGNWLRHMEGAIVRNCFKLEEMKRIRPRASFESLGFI